jgi:tRNA (cmo5U34)-methyltransferase
MNDSNHDDDPATSSLGHSPSTHWAFDDSVTTVFSDMLRRSIPQYEIMRQAVFNIGRKFAQPGTHIVDLGCSRGDALAPFIEEFGSRNGYVGVEVSQPMLEAARERFGSEIDSGSVEILDLDLRTDYPSGLASVTLCVLSLQFTPIDQRQRILYEAFSHTVPGGVLILVEKVLGATAEITALMVELYHQLKSDHGYTKEEVERKRLALEGILVPVTARWNEELMRTAGFTQIDCFWRWMNFAGWIAKR